MVATMVTRRGFILVLVLWMLLALTIAVSALAAWVSRTTDQAIVLSDARADQLAQTSSLETLKFLFATRPTRVGGLYLGPDPEVMVRQWRSDPFASYRDEYAPGDLPLDDRPVAALGDLVVSIQDEAGLMPLRIPDQSQLAALLAERGIAAFQRRTLIERLGDYRLVLPGSFDYSRLRAEYRARNAPPPPGRNLVAPGELLRIPGWPAEQAEGLASWQDLGSVLHSGRININTAPAALLRRLPDLDADQVDALLAERAQAPLSGGLAIPAIGGGRSDSLDPFSYTNLPGDSFRITVRPAAGKRALRYHLRLLPQQEGDAPWRVEMHYPIPASPARPRESENETAGLAPIPHPLFSASEAAGPAR